VWGGGSGGVGGGLMEAWGVGVTERLSKMSVWEHLPKNARFEVLD
jgi:hypothetical protein